MKVCRFFRLGLLAVLLSLTLAPLAWRACAQDEGEIESRARIRSAEELDHLLEPIALFPDPLLGLLLPASTVPHEVVLADRALRAGENLDYVDDQSWDDSVKGLARYPEVLAMMNDFLTWTVAVGEAFTVQDEDVFDSIQRLRAKALQSGELRSTAENKVLVENGIIEIVPAEPEVIYVPVYQTEIGYVAHVPRSGSTAWVGRKHSVGPWLRNDLDWGNRRVICWSGQQPRPTGWWKCSPSQRTSPAGHAPDVWRGKNHESGGGGNGGPGGGVRGGGTTHSGGGKHVASGGARSSGGGGAAASAKK